ncbi:MAG: tRNA glutamyl-Q(34) synthetase GluQRS [Alphaproteobacteria bacterium]
MKQPVFRFAPSPNGHLHLGHALSALIDFEMARALGGRFLLRIEDIDPTRCRPEFEQAIYEDLAWLDIAWEEPVRRQSENLDAYARALAKLEADGLLYPSFESRGDIARYVAEHSHPHWPHDPDGAPLYPGLSRKLSHEERTRRKASEPYALRLDMNAALARAGALTWVETGADPKQDHETRMAEPDKWGDVVLARKDTPTSYHLSVVVDDALQGVTHVVRGQDLYQATSVHRVLQALLGLPVPLYHHHRLIFDAEGKKLSKSTGATALRELRRQGKTPADIRRIVGLE